MSNAPALPDLASADLSRAARWHERARTAIGSWRIWLSSASFWTAAALLLGFSSYLARANSHASANFLHECGVQLCEFLPFIPLTPIALAFALRFPLEGRDWRLRAGPIGAGGLAFATGHVLLRALTPYSGWDYATSGWVAALGHSASGSLIVKWDVIASMFLDGASEDILFVYMPIVLIARAITYHHSVRDAELKKAQLESQLVIARLEALKSQLQPHFLFNTLHSISSLMMTDVAAADRMMSLLSDLLRMSLAGSSQLTRLGDELEFVNTYLEIEKIRFEERLTVEERVDADTLDLALPRLVLQPLVENAVRHGIAKRARGGCVSLSARREGDALVVRVVDDGPGLEPRPAGKLTGGVGIATTRARLATLYGEGQATLHIENAPGGGVEARLRIPLEPVTAFEAPAPSTALEVRADLVTT